VANVVLEEKEILWNCLDNDRRSKAQKKNYQLKPVDPLTGSVEFGGGSEVNFVVHVLLPS